MKKLILILLLLTGCTTSRILYTDQYGRDVYEAKCNAYRHTIGDCYKKASQICPRGFNVLRSSEQNSGSYGALNGGFSSNQFNAWSGTTADIKRNIMFTCR